jgi:hypothetical protein
MIIGVGEAVFFFYISANAYIFFDSPVPFVVNVSVCIIRMYLLEAEININYN